MQKGQSQNLTQQKMYIFQDQVSGKSAKLISTDNSIVYKDLSQSQLKFYVYMNSLHIGQRNYHLKMFIPQFMGTLIIKKPNIIKQNTNQNQRGIQENNKHTGQKQWLHHMQSRFTQQQQGVNQTNKIIQNKQKNSHPSISQSTTLLKHYIKLKNINQFYKYSNIMDIKLGTKRFKQSNKKYKDSTTDSKKFRINGLNALLVDYQELDQSQNTITKIKQKQFFLSKYYGQKITQAQIEFHLAFFFFNGKEINKVLLQKYIKKLKKLILCVKAFKGRRFLSSSLLLTYDPYHSFSQHQQQQDQHFYNLKLIDFDKMQDAMHQSHDQNVCQGILNLLYYFIRILENYTIHQTLIRKKDKKLRFFHQFAGVPQQKIKKYLKNKDKQQQQEKQ